MSHNADQIRIGVVGAGGRLGRTICAAIALDRDLDLVAAVDPNCADEILHGVVVSSELRALADANATVVIDFTVATAARVTLPWLALHGMHAVVGTTGFTDDDLAAFKADFTGSNCLIAANFTISAVLMMRFAEQAAPYFESAEIVEYHHERKVDAPSGTALATAQRMAAASSEWASDPTEREILPGARGGVGPDGIRIHSLRVKGMSAHQEVILGSHGQTLTIRQDSYDLLSYMPGIALACRKIADHPGLTIGLDSFL